VLWPSVAPATVPRAADLAALALASCGLVACGGPEGAASRGRRRAARVSRRDGGGWWRRRAAAGAQAAAAPSLLSVAGGERPGVDPAPSSGAPATSAALQEPSLHGPAVRETLPAAAPPASTTKRREEEATVLGRAASRMHYSLLILYKTAQTEK
jgi:hypothetical protein